MTIWSANGHILWIYMHVITIQTLVIWSASGRTVGVTLSSILTCSRTSSGILFNSAGLILVSYNWIEQNQYLTDKYTTWLDFWDNTVHISVKQMILKSVKSKHWIICTASVFLLIQFRCGRDICCNYEQTTAVAKETSMRKRKQRSRAHARWPYIVAARGHAKLTAYIV